jgi:hypothetical protein
MDGSTEEVEDMCEPNLQLIVLLIILNDESMREDIVED